MNGCRILVVEDNPDTADTLRQLLELVGYEAKVAYSGPQALSLVQEWVPEVVLSDIGLPGMNGWELARTLRQHPAMAKTRLIALTAFGSEADRRRSSEAGFESTWSNRWPPNSFSRFWAKHVLMQGRARGCISDEQAR
jgi:CheY-like chemotaxis protein